MNRRFRLTTSSLFIAFCCFAARPLRVPALSQEGQQPPAQGPTAPGVIKAQANLVIVDVIATDKKGNYIHDLEAKDFHVYEDGNEQKITSFFRTSDAKGPNAPAAN